MPDDGYLHVASFIEVVHYDKEAYPKGIKYFDVKQGGAKEAEEKEGEQA